MSIPSPALFIGLMSGTSVDAIDAVLVAFDERQAMPRCIASHSQPWFEADRNQLLNISQARQTIALADLAKLDIRVGETFAAAVHELLRIAKLPASDITAIGSHGQTLIHNATSAPGFSLQIGDPNTIAKQTGILTVADFRRADIAIGGQGAPLTPAFHRAVFQNPLKNQIILNIGGIGNLTLLPALNADKAVIGFDTGPGNCLIDGWIQAKFDKRFDDQGDLARQGSIHHELLELFLADNYFKKPFPKSTGRDYFNLTWVDEGLEKIDAANDMDVLATLVELTALSITAAIDANAAHYADIFVCGGGVHNEFLMERLQAHLPTKHLTSTREVGIDPDDVEAIAFAWLAKRCLEKRPGNIPSVTGAATETILGGIFHP